MKYYALMHMEHRGSSELFGDDVEVESEKCCDRGKATGILRESKM